MAEHPERPDCAGWHEPDPICDGDEETGERPCAYKSRCLAICSGVGGKARRTPELIEEWDEDRIDQYLAEQDGTDPRDTSGECRKLNPYGTCACEGPASCTLDKPAKAPSAASTPEVEPEVAEAPATPPRPPTAPAVGAGGSVPIPGFGTPVRKRRLAHDVHPRPSPRYDHVLPVVDAVVTRFARELGRAVKLENEEGMLVGDLYVRYTPGMSGRLLALYEATARNTARHRLIARFVLLRREPQLNMKTNSSDLLGCVGQTPPSSVVCRLWKDTKNTVALVGVDAHTARESAQWLARLYNAGLIEGRV